MGNVEAQLHHRALKALLEIPGSILVSGTAAASDTLNSPVESQTSQSVALRKFPNLFPVCLLCLWNPIFASWKYPDSSYCQLQESDPQQDFPLTDSNKTCFTK